MNSKSLTQILKKQIPLSQAMGIRVLGCSPRDGVKFSLPLGPNRNHKKTAFGGTLVAAQALASWAFLMAHLSEQEIEDVEVVLQRQESEFALPVSRDFVVETMPLSEKELNVFFKTLHRHGKARITVKARVLTSKRSNKIASTYQGEYVALRTRRAT